MLEEEGSKAEARLLHVGHVIVGFGDLLSDIPVNDENLLMSCSKGQYAVLLSLADVLIHSDQVCLDWMLNSAVSPP